MGRPTCPIYYACIMLSMDFNGFKQMKIFLPNNGNPWSYYTTLVEIEVGKNKKNKKL